MSEEAMAGAASALTVELEGGYPNARDCEHGSQRGKCEICDLKAEVEELKERVCGEWNPRWLLWKLSTRDADLPIYEYTIWIDHRWAEWCKQTGRPRHAHTKDDHHEFDQWLRRWTCREIVKTSAFGEPSNAPHEGPGAASSRTVPLDAVVGRQTDEKGHEHG